MQGLAFEWDGKKEMANRRKHYVGFAEASTVFGDPLSITIPDPNHAAGEERFVIIGKSSERKLLVVVHTMKDATMKERRSKRAAPAMRAEYDFSGGVRGKYADRYRVGVNVILLEPEVAAAFPDSKSVNDALRALLKIAGRTSHRKRA
jgi:uncharacterized DUF497 family protein